MTFRDRLWHWTTGRGFAQMFLCDRKCRRKARGPHTQRLRGASCLPGRAAPVHQRISVSAGRPQAIRGPALSHEPRGCGGGGGGGQGRGRGRGAPQRAEQRSLRALSAASQHGSSLPQEHLPKQSRGQAGIPPANSCGAAYLLFQQIPSIDSHMTFSFPYLVYKMEISLLAFFF